MAQLEAAVIHCVHLFNNVEEITAGYYCFLRWPIDDISDMPRLFWKKDEPLIFPTVISSGNAAIEKCSKEQGNIKNLFHMLYI